MACICCEQGHPKGGAVIDRRNARWCQQCQKDGCPAPKLPTPGCTVREHAGLEKVLHKMGINQPLMPDPELGQNVAFLANALAIDHEKLGLGQAHKLIEAVEYARASWIHHVGAPEILVAIHKVKGEPEHLCDRIEQEGRTPFCRVCGMQFVE